MDPYGRTRDRVNPTMSYNSSQQLQSHNARAQGVVPQNIPVDRGEAPNITFAKTTKRKRLAKACDACHKSKRRCDGTAPCSNCYFASKTCTYTDASGRPVPAPRSVPPAETMTMPTPGMEAFVHTGPQTFQLPPDSFQPRNTHDTNGQENIKRYRPQLTQGIVLPPDSIAKNHTIPPDTVIQGPAGLDASLTRELVNLFFTHRLPHRLIIHKPSFSTDLGHGRVPPYLLYTICALAAPVSKQPKVRTNPSRIAGMRFAEEATKMMFDGSGRLKVEPSLATAQALILLQTHESVTKPQWNLNYHDLALQVLETLGAHDPDPPLLTPVPPSPQLIQKSMERECVRRMFWVVHFMELVSNIIFKMPILPKESTLMLRLPADETSFELMVHSTLPEYLFTPAPKTKYASEFGHFIRVMSLWSKIEMAMDEHKNSSSLAWVNECEHLVNTWASSLADHLRWSEDNFQVQLSMMETSSNTGAWCYCGMHIVYATCTLALRNAKYRNQKVPHEEEAGRIKLIISSVGNRAKHSSILGTAIFPLLKYCDKGADPQTREWTTDHEETWGVCMDDCLRLEREQYSPTMKTLEAKKPRPKSDPLIQYNRDSPLRTASSSHDLRKDHGAPPPDRRLPAQTAVRLITDADIDPALQSGSVSRPSETTLPSLKSSGLLDSWSDGRPSPVSAVSAQGSVACFSKGDPQAPPRSGSPRSRYQPDSESSRSAPTSLPVGMAWLANEAAAPPR